MEQKSFLALGILIITILAVVPTAIAIGAAPARVSINYEPNKEITIPYTVRSNTDRDILVNVSLLGDLSKYVKISTNNMPLKPGETTTFDLTLKFPVLTGYVGPNNIRVSIAENAPVGGGFASRTVVIPKITVNFPYPGKYLDVSKFSVGNTNQGSPATVDLELTSRGTEFTDYTAIVDILDENNATIYTKNIASGSIKPQDSISKTNTLEVEKIKPGEYTAVLRVFYADQEKNLTSKFRIGTESLNLESYAPKNASFDSVIPLKFEIKNNWNGNFQNVYGEINIANATATTSTKSIGPFGDISLEQFIDLRGLQSGKYNGTITLHFDKNVKEFPITIDILKPESDHSLVMIIIVILLLVVLLGLSVVLYVRKRKNHNSKHIEKTVQSKKAKKK